MKTIIQIVSEALGKASALFMSQECKGTEIIMPSEKLNDIAARTTYEGVDYPKEICFCEHCFRWHTKWEDCLTIFKKINSGVKITFN